MIFTDKFLALDSAHIADEIRTAGFFALADALTPEFLGRIGEDVANHRSGINVNMPTGVFVHRQYFLTHMLTVSKAFFDYCTHPKILEISQALLGEKFRLKALRYYETYGGHNMQWHTDNKTDRGFAPIRGIIFISYISDVFDGEFQYVKGSQKWSGTNAYSDYSDELVASKHGADVTSFKFPRGSMVIYDTYGIHRARPVSDPNFERKSLFFQVDAEVNNAEPILVNTEFLDRMDDRKSMYLGFGLPGHYETYPITGLSTLSFSRETYGPLLKWMARGIANRAWTALPQPMRKAVKTVLGRG